MALAISTSVTTKMALDIKDFTKAVNQVVGQVGGMTKQFKKAGKESSKALNDIKKKLDRIDNSITTAKEGLELMKMGFEALKKGFEFMKKYSIETRDLDMAFKSLADAIGNTVAKADEYKEFMREFSSGIRATKNEVASMVTWLMVATLKLREMGEAAALTAVDLLSRGGGMVKGIAKSVYEAGADLFKGDTGKAGDLGGQLSAIIKAAELQYILDKVAREKAEAGGEAITLNPIDLTKSGRGKGAPSAPTTYALDGTMGTATGSPTAKYSQANIPMNELNENLRALPEMIALFKEMGVALDPIIEKNQAITESWRGLRDVGVDTFAQLSAGMLGAGINAVRAGKGFGEGMRAMTESVLSGLAQQAVAHAIMETAKGISALASPLPGMRAVAAGHFASAAMFGSVAVVSGAGAFGMAALAPKTASDSVSAGDFASTLPSAEAAQQSGIVVNVQGHVIGTEESLGLVVQDALTYVHDRGLAA